MFVFINLNVFVFVFGSFIAQLVKRLLCSQTARVQILKMEYLNVKFNLLLRSLVYRATDN